MVGPFMTVLWIAFAVLWVFTPDTLGHILTWIQGLPVALEVLLWIVFLPLVGSLHIWGSALALWLRVVLIVIIAVATIGGLHSRSRARSKRE